jgi:hypothetical protein
VARYSELYFENGVRGIDNEYGFNGETPEKGDGRRMNPRFVQRSDWAGNAGLGTLRTAVPFASEKRRKKSLGRKRERLCPRHSISRVG